MVVVRSREAVSVALSARRTHSVLLRWSDVSKRWGVMSGGRLGRAIEMRLV